jgi:hypothetical protein
MQKIGIFLAAVGLLAVPAGKRRRPEKGPNGEIETTLALPPKADLRFLSMEYVGKFQACRGSGSRARC